tara:strand:+ start:343 stop:615 length:273 start_codon:yes stop_codon:yes gene_type:complete
MGKSSRRNNRSSKSKTERKNNFNAAKKNHHYNQSICKSTRKMVRVSIPHKDFNSPQRNHHMASYLSGRQHLRYADATPEGDSLFKALFRK